MANWYYNSDNGAVDEQNWTSWFNGPDPISVHSGVGWHGPFPSKQAALDYYNTNKSANPGWKAPTGYLGTLVNGAQSVPGEVNRAATDAKKAVTDPLGKFNLGAWFLRIGEILLGLVLVGVGVAKLTGTSNVISKAAKVALA